MKRTVLALVALMGCADVDASETLPPRQLMLDGPAEYDVSGLSEAQQLLVLDVMADLNGAAGFEAFAVDQEDGIRPYGIINLAGVGCHMPEGKAGHSSWNLEAYRSAVCIEWKSDRVRNMVNLAHELLHTTGLMHDDDPTSVMHTPPSDDARGMPHHIAHIRKLAGLE